MPLAELVRLLCLSALWGASFLFMRIVSPDLGPAWTTESRVLLAGLALLGWQMASAAPPDWPKWRQHWRALMLIGIFNTALPFALLAFAALTLPVGYLAILNATAPMFGTLIGLVWLKESLTRRKLGAAVLGVMGVALVVRLGPVEPGPAVLLACAASVVAAMSYGWAANYLKRLAGSVPLGKMVAGTQLAAALAVVPLLPWMPVRAVPGWTSVGAALGLALGCTALAYVIYFRLVRTIGPTRTLTVTLLVPMFALLWGALFLDEVITGRMALGCFVVLVATWLFVSGQEAPRKSP